jgi:hypothetical protein
MQKMFYNCASSTSWGIILEIFEIDFEAVLLSLFYFQHQKTILLLLRLQAELAGFKPLNDEENVLSLFFQHKLGFITWNYSNKFWNSVIVSFFTFSSKKIILPLPLSEKLAGFKPMTFEQWGKCSTTMLPVQAVVYY